MRGGPFVYRTNRRDRKASEEIGGGYPNQSNPTGRDATRRLRGERPRADGHGPPRETVRWGDRKEGGRGGHGRAGKSVLAADPL